MDTQMHTCKSLTMDASTILNITIICMNKYLRTLHICTYEYLTKTVLIDLQTMYNYTEIGIRK